MNGLFLDVISPGAYFEREFGWVIPVALVVIVVAVVAAVIVRRNRRK